MKLFIWNSDQVTRNDSVSNSSCRNSVQGKYLIADDRGNFSFFQNQSHVKLSTLRRNTSQYILLQFSGYLCKRTDVMTNGCCNLTSSFTTRYSCDTCNSDGCCSVYENCISCCLNPNKVCRCLSSRHGNWHSTLRLIFFQSFVSVCIFNRPFHFGIFVFS